eukprot:28803-Lingulodinium_polyedra.AAC.1
MPLRRGIRSLDSVPDALMREVLCRCRGCDAHVFEQWSGQHLRHAFFFAMGGKKNMVLQKGMMRD